MSTATKRLPLIDLPISQKRHLGCLTVEHQGTKQELPLGSVDINAKVADRVASVTVKQTFRNTFSEHLEAVYIFPLAGGCVVSDFEMRVADRIVKGEVKERGQARADYVAAVQEGKRAALLEQERDDVFTMQVGNIPPNETITVVLTYSERLPFFESGKTELRLPLVVAPRYIPGTPTQSNTVGLGTEIDTDLVPDASRITPPRLVPGMDPNVALNVQVELATTDSSGTNGICDLVCSQHATQVRNAADAVTIQLAREDERLNRDFVLQWRLAADDVRSSLLVYRDVAESYGMISITPPKRDDYVAAPRDVVFVLDRSGSMGGQKMISAARACALLLSTLGPNDRFAIQAFDTVVEWLALPGTNNVWQSRWVDADEAGLERGVKFLRSIEARGGTEMYMALNEAFSALNQRRNDTGRIPILVVLTDGEVGNESQIFQIVQNQIAEARLFVVGIDTAVNSGLLRRLANLGGGTSAFVSPGAHLEQALQSIGREIGTPVVTDLQIVAENGATVTGTQTPERIPDLFEGRAVTAYIKLTGKGSVRVKGKWADGKTFEQKVKQTNVAVPAISQLWAKSVITDMEDSFRLNPAPQARQQMIALACKHSILTKLTAFVSVDHAEITNQTGDLRQVVQPVEMPAGWVAEGGVAGGAAGSAGWGSPLARVRSKLLGKGRSDAPQQDMDAVFDSLGVSSPQTQGGWGAPVAGGGWGSPPQAPQVQEAACDKLETASDKDSGWSEEAEQVSTGSFSPVAQRAQKPEGKAQAPQESQPFFADTSAAEASRDEAKQEQIGLPSMQNGPASAGPPPVSAPTPTTPPTSPSAPTPPTAPTSPSAPTPPSSPAPGTPNPSPYRMLKPVTDALGKLFNAADRNSLSDADANGSAKASSSLVALFEKFCKQLDELFATISADAVPADTLVDEFESTRKLLVAALGREACGTNVPLLQKFLRGAAVELVACLNHPTGTAAGARRIWERHMPAFLDARAEATTSLRGTSSESRFWEATL